MALSSSSWEHTPSQEEELADDEEIEYFYEEEEWEEIDEEDEDGFNGLDFSDSPYFNDGTHAAAALRDRLSITSSSPYSSHNPSCYVVGVEADAGIPAFSNVRRLILNTLSSQDVVNASKIHEHWYREACDASLWARLYTNRSKSRFVATSDLSFRFPSPVMYQIVEEVSSIRGGDLEGLANADIHRFIKGLGPIFTVRGCWVYAAAALQCLPRFPAFVLGPIDAPARPDCMLEGTHRYFLLLTQFLTSQTVAPRPAAIPWILALYEWVAYSPSAAHIAFNKAMLAPASFLVRSEVCLPLPRHIVAVIRTTTAVIERFVKGRYLILPSSSYTGSPHLLPANDPRHAYSVYIHVLLKYPEYRAMIEEDVSSKFGDVGLFELECARSRVWTLIGAASLRSKEMLETHPAEAVPVDATRKFD